MNTKTQHPTTLFIAPSLFSPDVWIETEELTKADRCDYCGAAAYVRAVKGASSLLFCGSHARKNIAGLVNQGWKLDDQTAKVFNESGKSTST